jgi:hypothetical protein
MNRGVKGRGEEGANSGPSRSPQQRPGWTRKSFLERGRSERSEQLAMQSVQEPAAGSLASRISDKRAKGTVVKVACPQGPIEDRFETGLEEPEAEVSVRVIVSRFDNSE